MNVTVYNIKTGKEANVPGVDAKEYIATGGWSTNPEDINIPEEKPAEKNAKAKK